jgi:hypothetical protein
MSLEGTTGPADEYDHEFMMIAFQWGRAPIETSLASKLRRSGRTGWQAGPRE